MTMEAIPHCEYSFIQERHSNKVYKCLIFTTVIDRTVRTTRPEKCDIFAQVISLNQLLQKSKNIANIFLTFINNVKIFLSQNIIHNF